MPPRVWLSSGKCRKRPSRELKKARFNVARIRKIESEVKHEIIAFLSCVAESVGDDARFLHVGMTSSDVMDTALAIQFKEASAILLQDVKDLMKVLRRQAFKHKWTVMIGRTHGVHAEPITFGFKAGALVSGDGAHLARLQRAVDEICVGQISGRWVPSHRSHRRWRPMFVERLGSSRH